MNELMENKMYIGERTDSGIPKICKTCADMHWPDIAIHEEFNPERTVTLLMLPDTADTEKPPIGAKKLDIGTEKLDIETEQPLVHTKLEAIGFSLPTRCNIERLIANITPEEVFGRSRIEEILDLSHGAASNLLRTMKENGLLESIKGRGKGKYRFTNQYWRES